MFIVKYSRTDRRKGNKIKIRFSPIKMFRKEDEFEGKAFSRNIVNGGWTLPEMYGRIVGIDEDLLVYCSSNRKSKKKIIKQIRKRKDYRGEFVMYFRKHKLAEFEQMLTKSVETVTGRQGQIIVRGIDVVYRNKQNPPNIFVKRNKPKFVSERELRFVILKKDSFSKINGSTHAAYLTSPGIVDAEISIKPWIKFRWIKRGKLLIK